MDYSIIDFILCPRGTLVDKSIHNEKYKTALSLIKKARIDAGITQIELAHRLNETQTFISKCERGERRLDIIELREFCIAIQLNFIDFVKAIEERI